MEHAAALMAQQFASLTDKKTVGKSELVRRSGMLKSLPEMASQIGITALMDKLGATTAQTNRIVSAVSNGVDMNVMKQVLLAIASASDSAEIARDLIDIFTSEHMAPILQLISEAVLHGQLTVEMLFTHLLNDRNREALTEIRTEYNASDNQAMSIDFPRLVRIVASVDFGGTKGAIKILARALRDSLSQKRFTMKSVAKMIHEIAVAQATAKRIEGKHKHKHNEIIAELRNEMN